MTRRRLYPMPVEALIDSSAFAAMPAAGAGIVLRLTLHFWFTNCRPLPNADHELRAIGRVHTPTWRRWKVQVLSVFEEIRPELEGYWRLREAKGTTLSLCAHATNSKRRLKALLETTPSPVPVFATGIVPKRDGYPSHSSDRPQRPLMVDRPGR